MNQSWNPINDEDEYLLRHVLREQDELTVILAPSECFRSRSSWWRTVLTTITSFITCRYDSMSMVICSASSNGGRWFNGGFNDTERDICFLQSKEIRSDEIEQKREEFFSYRLCSWSTVLSTRLLNRFSSSRDSRKLPLLVGPFADVDDRCSFVTNGEWATVGFVGVTLMVVEGFLFRSTDNEVEEQESVCSLIQEKTWSIRKRLENVSYVLLIESMVNVSSKSHIRSSDFRLQLSSSSNASWLRTSEMADADDNILIARCRCLVPWERCADGRWLDGDVLSDETALGGVINFESFIYNRNNCSMSLSSSVLLE